MANKNKILTWRLLTLLELGLYCISLTLLVLDATASERLVGQITGQNLFDVILACAVIVIAWLIYRKGHKLVDTTIWQVYFELATAVPTITFLMLYLFASRIWWWDVLLLGLTWRACVLLQVLPAAMALWKDEPS